MPIVSNRICAKSKHLPAQKRTACARAGQSIIESCFVICLICVVFMIMLQVAELTVAREVLFYAASCSARARTVGFNKFMVQKTGRIACIPNAGKMTTPDYENDDPYLSSLITNKPGIVFENVVANPPPPSGQYELERARIPDYLAAENLGRAEYYLNYDNWDSIVFDPGAGQMGDGTIPQILHVTAQQTYELWVPLHRTFYAGDTIDLQGSCDIENHYPLYIDDQSW
jgi:hypothetical protein